VIVNDAPARGHCVHVGGPPSWAERNGPMLKLHAASEGQAAAWSSAAASGLPFNSPSERAPSSPSSVAVGQSRSTLSGSFAARSNPPEPDPSSPSSSPMMTDKIATRLQLRLCRCEASTLSKIGMAALLTCYGDRGGPRRAAAPARPLVPGHRAHRGRAVRRPARPRPAQVASERGQTREDTC
jgi:hypothetical protein